MNILLDACTFLWIVSGSDLLTDFAKDVFRNRENKIFLSSVSAWEISMKHGLGRLPLPETPERYIPKERELHKIESLPLDEESTFYLPRLPQIHNDPFDRMLICQAIVNGMTILTADEKIAQYPIKTIWK